MLDPDGYHYQTSCNSAVPKDGATLHPRDTRLIYSVTHDIVLSWSPHDVSLTAMCHSD